MEKYFSTVRWGRGIIIPGNHLYFYVGFYPHPECKQDVYICIWQLLTSSTSKFWSFEILKRYRSWQGHYQCCAHVSAVKWCPFPRTFEAPRGEHQIKPPLPPLVCTLVHPTCSQHRKSMLYRCWKFHGKRTPFPSPGALYIKNAECIVATKPLIIDELSIGVLVTVSDIHHRLTDDRINQLSCTLKIPYSLPPPLIPEGESCGKKRLKLISLIALVPPAPIPPDVTEYVLIRGPCCKVGTGNKPT